MLMLASILMIGAAKLYRHRFRYSPRWLCSTLPHIRQCAPPVTGLALPRDAINAAVDFKLSSAKHAAYNWAQLQAAVEAAGRLSVPLYIPPSFPYTGESTWVFEGPAGAFIEISPDSRMHGAGSTMTTLRFLGSNGFRLRRSEPHASLLTLEGMHLRGDDHVGDVDHIGVYMQKGNFIRLDDLILEDFTDCLVLDAPIQSVSSLGLKVLQNKPVNPHNLYPRYGIRHLHNVQAARYINPTVYGEILMSNFPLQLPTAGANADGADPFAKSGGGVGCGGEWDSSLRYHAIGNPDSDGGNNGRMLSRPGSVRVSVRRSRRELDVVGCTATSPGVVTTLHSHGLLSGDRVLLHGIGGIDGAEGEFSITVLSATSFSIGMPTSGKFTVGGFMTRNADSARTLLVPTTGPPAARVSYNLRAFTTVETPGAGTIINPRDDVRSGGTLAHETYAVVIDFGRSVALGDEYEFRWADGAGLAGFDFRAGTAVSVSGGQVGGYKCGVLLATTDVALEIIYSQICEVGVDVLGGSSRIDAFSRVGNPSVVRPLAIAHGVSAVATSRGAGEAFQCASRVSGSHVVTRGTFPPEQLSFVDNFVIAPGGLMDAARGRSGAVETPTVHGLHTGDMVFIAGVDTNGGSGWNGWWTVAVLNARSFLLVGANRATNASAYTGGGTVAKLHDSLALLPVDVTGPREVLASLDLELSRGCAGTVGATVYVERSAHGREEQPSDWVTVGRQPLAGYDGGNGFRTRLDLPVVDGLTSDTVLFDGAEVIAYRVLITTDANTTATMRSGAGGVSFLGQRRANMP